MTLISTFLPFLLFAFVASITPGPTNILILASSQQPALRRQSHAACGGERLRCRQRDCLYLRCGRRADIAGTCTGENGDELGGRGVVKLDELAAVSCAGHRSAR